MTKIKVQMFKEVKGLCFIKCPICNSPIIVKDDGWSKCKYARDDKHMKSNKYVFRLKRDNSKEGFSEIIQAEVKNYAKQYGIKEMEYELNGKSILL